MEKKICFLVLGMLVILPHSMHGAAVPLEKTIRLRAVDGIFELSEDVAKLSKTIKHLIKDLPGEETQFIPLKEINGKTLAKLIPLMQNVYNNAMPAKNEPLKEQIQKINKISLIIKLALSDATIDEWRDLAKAVDYLDIESLKKPLADSMIQYIHGQYKGNKDEIEAIIVSLDIPNEFKNLLAKYWYFNYSEGSYFILENLDYGFSIDELAEYGKLPRIKHNRLTLKNLRINDLTGLTLIPNIAAIKDLDLYGNRLTSLPENIFSGLKHLRALNLDNNQLVNLPGNIFNGLNELGWLSFNDNKLTTLPANIFKGLSQLQEIHLSRNLLASLPENIFEGLDRLVGIYLDDNRLETLPANIFKGLRLWGIYLSDNELETLPENLFNGLHKLERLDLAHNLLETLPQNIFHGLDSLEKLDLERNLLNPEIKEALRAQFGGRVKL